MFSYFSANPNKITMILISVGVSIGSVGLPLLTENYVKGDLPAAARLVQDSLTMLFLFLLPATVGVVMVGEPLYTVFYGKPDSLAMGLFCLCSFAVYYPRLVYGLVSYASGYVPKPQGSSLLYLWFHC